MKNDITKDDLVRMIEEELEKKPELQMESKCPGGGIYNPATGKCTKRKKAPKRGRGTGKGSGSGTCVDPRTGNTVKGYLVTDPKTLEQFCVQDGQGLPGDSDGSSTTRTEPTGKKPKRAPTKPKKQKNNPDFEGSGEAGEQGEKGGSNKKSPRVPPKEDKKDKKAKKSIKPPAPKKKKKLPTKVKKEKEVSWPLDAGVEESKLLQDLFDDNWTTEEAQ